MQPESWLNCGMRTGWERSRRASYIYALKLINYSKSGSKTEVEMLENGGNLGGGSVAESS